MSGSADRFRSAATIHARKTASGAYQYAVASAGTVIAPSARNQLLGDARETAMTNGMGVRRR